MQTTPVAPFGVPTPGTPPTQWGFLAPAPRPAVPTGRAPPPQIREDIHHPKIKLLMDPYLKKFNNFVNLSKILTSLGKRMPDLPTLPKYCHPTGQPFICWNSVLGKCVRGSRCKFSRRHLSKGDATDKFADAVNDCIGKDVLYYTNLPVGARSPNNKRKGVGGGPMAEA